MTAGGKSRLKWGDDEEEETDYETPVDAHGIKERVKISHNAKGQKVKVITRIKVQEIKVKVPKRVAERRNLPRFGDAQEGEQGVTLLSKDLISIEHPDDQLDADVSDPTLSNTLGDFMAKLEQRKMERELDLDEVEALSKETEAIKVEGEDENKQGSGKYVPPGQRGLTGAARFGSSLDALANRSAENDNTLRVSNLTKSVTEDDLRDLFSRFGRITRVSLPRDVDRQPRGFAYISFLERRDAEYALEKLQGFGYDHLILRLEWAKPSTKDPSQDNSMQYRSGYGTQLAQDTKEKVLYASNLTGNK